MEQNKRKQKKIEFPMTSELFDKKQVTEQVSHFLLHHFTLISK